MASDKLFRALDLLAGTAAQEIDEARDFQVQQNLRLDALARLSQKQQQDTAFQQEQLDLRKDQLKQAADLHKVTEQRLTAEFGATEKRVSKQAQALNRLKEAEIQAGITKSNIAAQAGITTSQNRLVLAAEESLNEAQPSGLTDQELLPFYEKLRLAETAVWGRPITSLPKPEEELPPPPPPGETQTEGTGFSLDFLTENFLLNLKEDTVLGIPFSEEGVKRKKQRKALRELQSAPEFQTLERQ